MHVLMIANTISAGFMFAIWSKSNLLNILFKMAFLGLLVANIVALAKM